MKRLQQYLLLLVISATALPVQSDDLDAALEAQKKARRHVYSERATLHNQELVVPKAPTEEELALDRKLREMERALDQKASITPRDGTRPPPRPVRPVQENKNWLTPALMDEDAALSLADDGSDSSWILNEMERQKSIKEEKLAIQEEDRRVADLLKREDRQEIESTQLDRLKRYEQLPGMLPGNRRDDTQSSYSTLQQSLSLVPSGRQSRITDKPALFSPAAARASSQPEQPDPFKLSSSRINFQSLTERREAEAKKNSPFTPSWERKTTRQPTRLETIRKSRPIHQADPFADDGSSTF
jgi:hypothetical protein